MQDKHTLKILNKSYIADKDHIYFTNHHNFWEFDWETINWEPIEEADPSTFEILSDKICRDKNYIFVYGKPNKKIDRESFEMLDSEGLFSKDKNHFYIGLPNDFKDADPNSIELLTLSSNPAFLKDKKHGYFFSGGTTKIIEDSHGETFRIIAEDCLYSYDKDNVYFEEKKIPNANPSSFSILKSINRSLSDGATYNHVHYAYAKDKTHIYFLGKPIPNADMETFKVLEETYASDKNNVYCNGRNMRESNLIDLKPGSKRYPDSKTFRVLDYQHSADEKYVYYESPVVKYEEGKTIVSHKTKIINYADGESFVLLSRYHARDKHFGYFNTHHGGFTRIEESDGPSFETMGEGYSRDKNFVYHRGIRGELSRRIPGSDGESFTPIMANGDIDARDNKQHYWRGEVVTQEKLTPSGYSINRQWTPIRKSPEEQEITMHEIRKIHPNLFNPFFPSKRQIYSDDGTLFPTNYENIKKKGNLGNYDWTFYQYKIIDDINLTKLIKSKNMSDLVQFKMDIVSAKCVDKREVIEFVTRNYNGEAPYGTPIGYVKAKFYATKLLKSVLECPLREATYIFYEYDENAEFFPYLTFGFYGILDIQNKEYFELVMGGVD